MNKPLFGLLLGAVLGALDGLTAWFTPEVRPQIIGIVIGSTFKGVIAGVCIGWFAKKVKSLPLGILFGLAVGMFLAYLIAAMPQPSGKHYYFEIMLPGSLVGAIVGYATQRHQPAPQMDTTAI
jgi:ABC-type Fe3+-siderophore transport system permease subunit